MANEMLKEYYDKYTRDKVSIKEQRLSFMLKSQIPKIRARLLRQFFKELVAAGFSKAEAMEIICSGIVTDF